VFVLTRQRETFIRLGTLFIALGVLGVSVLALRAGAQSAAWQDPSPHQVRFVTVDSSIRLEVLDWGGAGQPIVLLGCYLTAHAYDDFAPKLRDQFHVYGITRRGVGASDKPRAGYTVDRAARDVIDVLDALRLEKPMLVGTSCAGQVMTAVGIEYPDRPRGLVYLNAVEDPTLTPLDYNPPFPESAKLPPRRPEPPPDLSSFAAYRVAQRRDHGVAFPEAELRQLFVANADGSLGSSLLAPDMRRAVTEDSRVKPDYGRLRAPVLAMFSAPQRVEDFEREWPPRNEQERAAVRQQYAATNGMVGKWRRNLLAALPTARVVDLAQGNLYLFLSNESEVLREIRAFSTTTAR
jgi:pimeloyl-ACP methyl ester carboxylesterase